MYIYIYILLAVLLVVHSHTCPMSITPYLWESCVQTRVTDVTSVMEFISPVAMIYASSLRGHRFFLLGVE